MIKKGITDLAKAFLGSTPIQKIMKGSEVVWESVKYYGGIRCDYDNRFCSSAESKTTLGGGQINKNYFQTYVYADVKQLTFGYGGLGFSSGIMRFFKSNPVNNPTDVSFDYWSIATNNRTVDINRYGTHLVFTVSKENAKYFRAYDPETGIYYIKGSAVE